jgi:hypothetical protein
MGVVKLSDSLAGTTWGVIRNRVKTCKITLKALYIIAFIHEIRANLFKIAFTLYQPFNQEDEDCLPLIRDVNLLPLRDLIGAGL